MAKDKPFTGNTFNKVETMRGAFESQYGAPPDENKKVLIGMRGGKAVYGDELDAVDTTGAQYVGTYSKNQAAMDDIFKETARSGGMYNPSSNNIPLEGTPAVTEADKKVTYRASDGQKMIGALSPEAAAMREKTGADQQFANTLTRIKGGTPKTTETPATPTATETRPMVLPFPEYSTEDQINESKNKPSPNTPAGGDAQPAGIPPVTYSNPMLGILGGQEPTETAPAFDVKGENANFLNSLRGKNIPQQPSVAPPVAVANQKGTTNKPQTPVFSPYQDQVSGMLAFGEDPEDWGFSKNRRGNYA
jgi:cell pole-organizing protein PopZ